MRDTGTCLFTYLSTSQFLVSSNDNGIKILKRYRRYQYSAFIRNCDSKEQRNTYTLTQ